MIRRADGHSVAAMTKSTAVPALVAGGIAVAVGGIAEQVAQTSTSVSDDLFQYPWSSDTYIAAALYWAAAFGIVLLGLIRLRNDASAAEARGLRGGLAVAIAGIAVVAGAQIASIDVRGQAADSTGAVVAMFGVGTLLLAGGLIVAGRAALRSHRESRFPRALLAAGAWTLVLIALVTTPLAQLADVVFGILLAAAGLPAAAPRRDRSRSIALR
jgi:hypothetical protein